MELRESHRSAARGGARSLLAIAGLAFTAAGCADHIGRGELLARIDAGSAPAIVDVRSAGEYAESHVPGAVHIPFYSLLGNSERVPQGAGPDEPVVVYCEHGPRAGIARAQLWFALDRPVLFLDGHMTAWKEDGLRVEAGVAQGP